MLLTNKLRKTNHTLFHFEVISGTPCIYIITFSSLKLFISGRRKFIMEFRYSDLDALGTQIWIHYSSKMDARIRIHLDRFPGAGSTIPKYCSEDLAPNTDPRQNEMDPKLVNTYINQIYYCVENAFSLE